LAASGIAVSNPSNRKVSQFRPDGRREPPPDNGWRLDTEMRHAIYAAPLRSKASHAAKSVANIIVLVPTFVRRSEPALA